MATVRVQNTGAFQNNTFDAGIPKYAHISGGVDFRRRSAFQLSSSWGNVWGVWLNCLPGGAEPKQQPRLSGKLDSPGR